ncbi:BolA family protein [Candidatus Ruthia magnifica str. Cm (Calyptogena magnifica)]|uniref:BolA family protein n=1 Tax=Ruthia magnifica subsp. Calyptogena magnifica TaxID=413404 RepID=A1AVG4_RUTMC|nr:BolA/IbaG family iron-sulfur metabolism protein [Candidatus Ruthturnera calyptogenae]ABL01921.1 BolA family protein [Candidatus Ruthia magnifica str. Cm (Calyptogena magnifica)]
MTLEEIQAKIQMGIKNSTVTMGGDGCSCSTKVVSSIFEGMPLLARQKMVLAVMNEEITNGTLHALSIKTRTPEEDV